MTGLFCQDHSDRINLWGDLQPQKLRNKISSCEKKVLSPDFKVTSQRSLSPTLTQVSPHFRVCIPMFFYRYRVNFGWSRGSFQHLTSELMFTHAVTLEELGHSGCVCSWSRSSLCPFPPTSSLSSPARPNGSGLWGPVTGGSTPHCCWKILYLEAKSW